VIVLLVVMYFVATSSGFFKGVILPRVGKAMNAQVTVSDASISPFSKVVLHNLKVQTTGPEPLVTAPEVRLRYSLLAILGGNIRVDEVALVSPTVALVENHDGSSNLDPIMQAQAAEAPEKEPASPAKPGKPMQIDLKKFTLTDATIRQVKNSTNGTRELIELSHVNVTMDDLKNGQTGKLALAADMRAEYTNGLVQAKLGGDFTFALLADLKPATIKGSTRLDVSRAEGALADFAAVGAVLGVDVTPTEIKDAAVRFQKGQTHLGELRASGPFDMEKLEGRLSIVLSSIDQRLLDLAGAQSGLNFGPTTIGSTNLVELTKGGSIITARGQVDVKQFQVTRMNQTTPRLDLHKDYDLTVDRGQSLATLRGLNLMGTQNGNPLLTGALTSPMQITWGNAGGAASDSALTLKVLSLNLADWKPFLGEIAPAGLVAANARLLSQQGGRQVTFDCDSRIDHLTAIIGSNQLSDATITLQANGKAIDLRQFNLASLTLEAARQSQALATMSASGTYDMAAETADMRFNAQAALAPLLQALPQPDTSVSAGTVDLKAHFTQKQKAQTVTGTFALADFTGRYGKNELNRFGATADFDAGMTPQEVQVRKAAGKVTQGANAGGSYDFTAKYNLSKQTAEFKARLADWNQHALGPFLAPMLAGRQVVSAGLNANAAGQYDPQGSSALKADMQLANLIVKDSKGQSPATPLEAKMQADVSLRKQVADVRQFQVALTPTARAKNQAQLSGQVDMSRTNAITGELKLTADSIDLTSYYDLFMSGEPAAAGSATSPSAPAPADANQEPEAIQLPLRNFTVSAAIGRFYLHEVDIADWQTTVKMDGGRVVMNPIKLTLNGAPVSSTVDLDLGVPGWKYDLAFNAQAVPLAPLVNSFQPEMKGQLGGTATAQGKLTGAGTTGASLQKNLAGQFDMTSTNLNYSVVNLKNPMFKGVVNVIAGIPELLRNPAAGLGSLLGNLTGGKAGASGGLADDLQRSPIDALNASLTAGSGRVDLKQAVVQSAAFLANASGTITLAPVLTNSTLRIPVAVSLSQPIARRMNLASADTNATYAKLPDFLTMSGTVGEPKADIKKGALAGTVLKSVTGFVPAAGDTAGGLLGSILGTKPAGTTNQTATNQPGGAVGGLLQGIGGILGKGAPAETNASATNKAPSRNPLKGIFR